jgi:hypothetical protein
MEAFYLGVKRVCGHFFIWVTKLIVYQFDILKNDFTISSYVINQNHLRSTLCPKTKLIPLNTG